METDKRQQLLEIIKKAALPPEIEKLLVDDVDKQQTVTDDYILDIADALERLGNYFKTAGEVQSEYLDSLVEEAQKAGNAVSMLESIADELEQQEASATPQVPAESQPAETQPQASQPEPVVSVEPPVQPPTQ